MNYPLKKNVDLSSYGIVVNLNLRPIICHDVSLQASDTDTKRQLNESQVTFSSHHKSCMTRSHFLDTQTNAMKKMSKCHAVSVNILSINTPPFIRLPDVCADLQPSEATCVISSLRLGCSRGVDTLASRRVEGRTGGGGEIEMGRVVREAKRGMDSGGRKRKKRAR